MNAVSPVNSESLTTVSAVMAAAAALRAALSRFDPEVLRGPDCARVTEELATTEKACRSVRLVTAARAVHSGAHLDAGYRDGAAWLARQSGVTGQQARRDLETADRLDDCPETRAALLAGEISVDQAAEITRAEAEAPGVEARLLPVARRHDLSQLRDRAREEVQARTPVSDLRDRQRRARSLRHWRDQTGMVCFAGKLIPEVGVPLINRLEQQADRLRRAARAGDSASPAQPPEKWEAYAADAFAEMCAPSGDAKRSARSELVIVCDINAWRRGSCEPGEPCHIIGGGPIPVDVARELSQDAFLKAVLHDGVAVQTVKHFGRYLPVELRTALDLGPPPDFTGRRCEECGSRWGLEYDHIDPVDNQGLTSYDNIQALCWADHQAKTLRDRRAGLIGNRRGATPVDDP